MSNQDIVNNPKSIGTKLESETVISKKGNLKAETLYILKKFRFVIVFTFAIMILYYMDMPAGVKALKASASNTQEMLCLIPPIFIFMGLLDTWIPKEVFIRYMGENSGLKGVLTALFLGSAAAGPLYIAFPIAVLLMKKKARLAYILFFLGVWSTTKIPLLIYEISYMGARFTAIQVAVCIPLFLLFSLVIEKILSAEDRESLYSKAESEFP